MNFTIKTGLVGALFAICAIENQASAKNDSAEISTTILIAPLYSTYEGSQQSTKSSQDSSAGSASERSDEASSNQPKSSKDSADFSRGSTADTTNESKADSAKNSSARERWQVKLVVPFRARTEAAALLANRSATPPSVLLRSILTELQRRRVAQNAAPLSQRELVAQLVALPGDEG